MNTHIALIQMLGALSSAILRPSTIVQGMVFLQMAHTILLVRSRKNANPMVRYASAVRMQFRANIPTTFGTTRSIGACLNIMIMVMDM
jgi:hypothetical protein